MKKVGFEHQGTSTYLVYELGEEDAVDSMSLGMLMNNPVPGFLPAVFTQMDNTKFVKCDVTARVPAEQYLLGTVNRKRLLGVFQGVAQAFLSAEDFMIDTSTIQLELGSIFSEVATGATGLISVPVLGQEPKTPAALCDFFKNILFSAQYDERENQNYVAKLMSYLNGTPVFSITEFKGILDYLAAEPPHRQIAQEYAAVGPRPIPDGQQVVTPPVGPAPQMAVSIPVSEMPASTSAAAGVAQKEEQQKDQISLFYLLQHYNKDNAAKYKAQKEQKKAAKKKSNAEKQPAEPERAAQARQSTPDFAVPGQKEMECKAEEIHVPPTQPPVWQPMQQQARPAVPLVQPPMEPPTWQPVQQQAKPMASPAQPLMQPPVQQSAVWPVQTTAPQFGQPSGMSFAAPLSPVPDVQPSSDDTSYFSEETGDETVLFGQEPEAKKLSAMLIRRRNNERIPITKAVFRMGRDAEYNDYYVQDNRYIGHGHCHIITRGGEYFVVDDNSKNHTKVNGQIIAPGIEVKIAHGCVITLADEDFEFKLY